MAKRRRTKRIITARFIKIVAVFGGVLTLTMVYLLMRMIVKYSNSRENYQQIADAAVSVASATTMPTITPTFVASAVLPEKTLTPTATPYNFPITVDWVNLRAMNKQIIGWLYCEDTNINYPVMQTKNNVYYLTHNAKKKEDQAGALFFDYRNSVRKALENIIIYGHRMKDGSMFGHLARFSEKDYVDRHTQFYLFTPDQNYTVQVFACRTVHPEAKYFPTSFTTIEAETKYINKAFTQSYWQVVPNAKPEGAILITFATCSKYDYSEDPRLLVHGWAVPIA